MPNPIRRSRATMTKGRRRRWIGVGGKGGDEASTVSLMVLAFLKSSSLFLLNYFNWISYSCTPLFTVYFKPDCSGSLYLGGMDIYLRFPASGSPICFIPSSTSFAISGDISTLRAFAISAAFSIGDGVAGPGGSGEETVMVAGPGGMPVIR